ncbi:MAG: SpoIIE family protein phosphatase [Gammaproteobacteria bacterium]
MDQFKDIPATKIMIVKLDRSDDGAVVCPRITYVNHSAAEFLGYGVQELRNQTLEMVYPEGSQRDSWLKAISQLTVTTMTSVSFAGEIVRKNKSGVPVFLSLMSLPGQHLNVDHILILIQDTNQPARKQPLRPAASKDSEAGLYLCREVESALVESEERFRQMADMAGEWLWEQDPDGYYIYSSTAVNQILGYTQKEVIGKHYTQFLTDKDKEDQQSYAAIHQPFYGLTNHYQHKDGHLVITESTGLPIIDADGKLLKWRGVDRDITARKQFQDALIESEKRIRLIIESSLSAIVIMDSYGMITDWNHQAEKIFGWSRAEAIGQPLAQLIIPERLRHAHRLGLQQFLRTGSGPLLNRLIEQVALRRDQSEFPVELSISPMKEGNAYSFSAFIHDISSRKAAEREIREGQVKLAIARNEISIARTIQASLSPSEPIRNEHFEVTGFCLPADQVGGDYFDYFYHEGHRLEMVIADVSGHSIGPGLFMVEARSAIRALASGFEAPAEKLNLLNQFLYEDLDKSDFFITLFYMQYDSGSRRLSFANAGHPPPLLFQSEQSICKKLDAEGLILGVDKNVDFEEIAITLNRGDAILMYTDGLTEAENAEGDFFGFDRVCDIFRQYACHTPQQIIDVMLEQLKQFCGAELFNDDITLLVFKCK